MTNLEKYKKDIDSLIGRGNDLRNALLRKSDPTAFNKEVKKHFGDEIPTFLKNIPDFNGTYQSWYSEAKAVIRQLLPDRLEDFSRLYERPKSRKDITYENYTIEDALHGLEVTRGYAKDKVVGIDAALPRMAQQIAMIEGVRGRFESTLFDIRQLMQADLFDSELDAASHLLKNRFGRAAGALAGVVLEKHLGEVASSHKVPVKKKDPSIADLNDALKAAEVIDVPQWRGIQRLGDLRNLCDHNKQTEPTLEQVQDLLDGAAKTVKTIF